LNFKANFNVNNSNESQFGYFDGAKEKDGRGFDPPNQAEETLWDQGSPGTILEGIWTGQHTWIPNDHTILNARYGYIGNSFQLAPKGGNCAPAPKGREERKRRAPVSNSSRNGGIHDGKR
jgi:hypothetical protein